jgi:hypothetical protein
MFDSRLLGIPDVRSGEFSSANLSGSSSTIKKTPVWGQAVYSIFSSNILERFIFEDASQFWVLGNLDRDRLQGVNPSQFPMVASGHLLESLSPLVNRVLLQTQKL